MPNLPAGINAAYPLNAAENNPSGTDRLIFTAEEDLQVLSRALDDTPTDFETMETGLQIEVRWITNTSDDTVTVRVRIINGGTILAAADAGGAFQDVGSRNTGTTTNQIDTATFGFVNTTADKATWDGASVEIQQGYAKNMAGDNAQAMVDFIELSGNYVQSALINIGSIAPAGHLLLGIPEFRNAVGVADPWHGRIERAANGALYTAAPREDGAERNYRITVWKSVDAEIWRELHTFTAPGTFGNTTDPAPMVCFMDGNDILHIGWAPIDNSVTTQSLVYAAWDCAADAVEHSPELVRDATTEVGFLRVHHGAVRSNGEIIWSISKFDGGAFTEFDLIRGNAGSWTTHADVSTDAPGTPRDMLLIPDANGDVHMIFTDTNFDMFHRNLRAANTLGATQTIGPVATNFLYPHSGLTHDGRLFFAGPGSANQVRPTVWESDALGDAPTWTLATITTAAADQDGAMRGLTLDLAGSRLIAGWIDEGDQQPRWAEYDPVADTWGSPETLDNPFTQADGWDVQTFAYSDGADDYILYARVIITGVGSRETVEVLISGGETIFGSGTVAIAGDLAMSSSKTLTGSTAPAGSLVKALTKTLDGVLTKAGSVTHIINRTISIAGTVALAGVHLLRAVSLKAGTVTPTADVSRETRLTQTGETTPAGNVSRETEKLLTGDLTLSGVLRRTVAKALEATITSTGQTISAVLKLLAGAISPAGASSHQGPEAPGSITVGGTLTTTGDLLRSTAHSIDGLIAPEGILARYIAQIRTGETTPTGAFGPTTITKIFSSNVTPAGTVSRYIAHLLIGSIEPTATLTSKIAKALGSTLTTAATVALEINPSQTSINLAGSLALAGDRLTRVGKALDGAVTPASEITKTARTTESGTLTPAGTVSPAKRAILAISGTLNMVATLTKTTLRRYAGTITPQTALRRRVSIGIASTLTTTGALVKHSRRTLTAAITFTSTVATEIFSTLAGPISRLIRGQGHAKGIHHQGRTRKDIK